MRVRLQIRFRLFLLLVLLGSAVSAFLAVEFRRGSPHEAAYHLTRAHSSRVAAEQCAAMADAEANPSRAAGLRLEAKDWLDRAAHHEWWARFYSGRVLR